MLGHLAVAGVMTKRAPYVASESWRLFSGTPDHEPSLSKEMILHRHKFEKLINSAL